MYKKTIMFDHSIYNIIYNTIQWLPGLVALFSVVFDYLPRPPPGPGPPPPGPGPPGPIAQNQRTARLRIKHVISRIQNIIIIVLKS